MKYLKCFICFLLALIMNVFSEQIDAYLNVNKIMPDLYVVTHAYPWPSNSVCAIMENGDVVLVDVPYTPDATEKLLQWIHGKLGERKIIAVNTHFHVDRLGGNAALVKHDIPIYSSGLTLTAIRERGTASLKLLCSWVTDETIKKYYQQFAYIPPNRIFDAEKGLTLSFGKENVLVRYYGVGHSVDNLAVFFPAKKVLFGGCMILSSEAEKIGNVSDGDPVEWLSTLGRIDADGYEHIIPGHGKSGGVELLSHTKKLLQNHTVQRNE